MGPVCGFRKPAIAVSARCLRFSALARRMRGAESLKEPVAPQDEPRDPSEHEPLRGRDKGCRDRLLASRHDESRCSTRELDPRRSTCPFS